MARCATTAENMNERVKRLEARIQELEKQLKIESVEEALNLFKEEREYRNSKHNTASAAAVVTRYLLSCCSVSAQKLTCTDLDDIYIKFYVFSEKENEMIHVVSVEIRNDNKQVCLSMQSQTTDHYNCIIDYETRTSLADSFDPIVFQALNALR